MKPGKAGKHLRSSGANPFDHPALGVGYSLDAAYNAQS